MTTKSMVVFLVCMGVVLSSCENATPDGTVATPTTGIESTVPDERETTSQAPSVPPAEPSSCDRDNTTDCAVVALVFDEPLRLSDALAATDGFLALAVFRSEPMCVVANSFVPNPADRTEVLSWFAYVDAEGIEPRVRNNPGTPPITGGFINQSFWDHFVAEWQHTEREDALTAAVVVHAPVSMTVDSTGVSRVAEVVPIDSYRRDATDERFPGELYIRNHAAPDAFRTNPDDIACDG